MNTDVEIIKNPEMRHIACTDWTKRILNEAT